MNNEKEKPTCSMCKYFKPSITQPQEGKIVGDTLCRPHVYCDRSGDTSCDLLRSFTPINSSES